MPGTFLKLESHRLHLQRRLERECFIRISGTPEEVLFSSEFKAFFICGGLGTLMLQRTPAVASVIVQTG